MICANKNHQLLDNLRREMCAPIRYNLTRAAKYANVPYQHPGRMARLKIWHSIQSNGAREGINYGEDIRIPILIFRKRSFIIHIKHFHRARGRGGESPSNNWNFQITHLLTYWAHANVRSDKLTQVGP